MSIDQFEVEFTKDGTVFDADQVKGVLDHVDKYTDLYVISHGWNNNRQDAASLYDRFFQSIREVQEADLVSGLEDRRFGAVRLFWPSKKFEESELIPGGGAASATTENHQALQNMLAEMKRDPQRLGGDEINDEWASHLSRAAELVPKLDGDADARREFIQCLRDTLDPSEASSDDGSEEFFERDAEELFTKLGDAVVAPLAAGGGGATSLDDAGGAAGLRDLLSGTQAAARRVANFTTYYKMKARAGLVGRTGVARLLHEIRKKQPGLRLHLIGHSFGGRLVTAAAHALAPNTPDVTVTLLQAAFSHNGLAQKFDGRHDGFFRDLVTKKRVSGPILITHTKNDRAVGIAYPLASRIARQKAAALGDENDPYGGMGRNGAQHTPEVSNLPNVLQDLGQAYQLRQHAVFNLRADRFINDHSDVTGHQVAYAVLHAVAAV